MEITHIPSTDLTDVRRKRVAVYARISSDKDAAENSLDAQIQYFKRKITNTPGWVLAETYVDDGISGTIVSRPAFQRMMEDARAGKIDYIITKSITRFARNTILLLESIRELKTLGINVEFENDHINTMSRQGELLISLLAMHAEEQSKSASDNKRWQIKRYFESGVPTYVRMYGYQMIDNHLEIIPEEATLVQRIYDLYLSGLGFYAIAKRLNAEGHTFFNRKWKHTDVIRILDNEKYKGDMLLQKTYRPDYRTKKKRYNHGELAQYYVSGSHEAIIPPEIYDKVKVEGGRRRELYSVTDSEKEKEPLFKNLIVCGHCKTHFVQKMNPTSTGRYPVYKCQKKIYSGKDSCGSKQIRESILIQKTKEVLNLAEETELTREIILENITAIVSVADNQLRFYHTDGHVTIANWQNPSRKDSWTEEMKERARQKAKEQHQKGEK